MDLHERRELDMGAQVARVRARARPWRSIIFLLIALCGVAAGEYGRYARHLGDPERPGIIYGGAAIFLLFGLIAAFGLSGQARSLLQPVVGAAHAGVARYALVLISIFVVAVVTLNIADVPVGQLVLGGAVTGVLLGIAAQQSLANLFAGMVLLLARPFRVGDRVRLRAGALSGSVEGVVTDVSITYVRLETEEGLIFVPNSQALAATIGPITSAQPPDAARAPAQDGGLAGSALAGAPGNEAILAVVASAAASAAATAVAASQGAPVRPAEAASAALASVTAAAGPDGANGQHGQRQDGQDGQDGRHGQDGQERGPGAGAGSAPAGGIAAAGEAALGAEAGRAAAEGRPDGPGGGSPAPGSPAPGRD